MLEHLTLEVLASLAQLGVVLEAFGEGSGPLVEASPNLMVRIAVDVTQEPAHAVEESGEDSLVEGLRQPPRRFLAKPCSQGLAVLVEEALEPPQDSVEELLVALLGRHQLEGPPGHGGD